MDVRRRRLRAGTVFFGVGAQCSGTSWLTDLLREYPDCALPFNKELHFFDSLYLSSPRAIERYTQRVAQAATVMRNLERKVDRRLSRPDATSKPIFGNGLLAEMDLQRHAEKVLELVEQLQICDVNSFVKYMERLRERKHANVVGEFTPSYAMLPADAYRIADRKFEGCRFIFIMRDPVQRFWSQARHGGKLTGAFSGDPNKKVTRYLDDAGYRGRSDYRTTIETLESVVPADRIFYGFYERMTSPATIIEEMRRLEDFLGLDPLPEEFLMKRAAAPSNVSPKIALAAENRALIAEALAPQYDFIEQKFGALPPRWSRH